jgi:hypothetical protein
MNGRPWRSILEAGFLFTLVIGCDAPRPTAPAQATRNAEVAPSISDAELVRQLAVARGVVALAPTPYVRPALRGSARRWRSTRS